MTHQPHLQRMIAAIALVLASTAAHPAPAGYPDRPIKLIIPYSAGGGADNTSRTVAQKMTEVLGQNVIVENRPGASGTLAESLVVQAPADGYTVLYDTFAFSINASARKLPFNPRRDLQPVSLVATAAMILVANPLVPAKTLPEFLDHARANPGKVTYASYGMGSAAHLASELLSGATGISMLHVPYKGGAPALVDVVGGRVDVYFANASSGLPYVRSGKLRALAVSSAGRLGTLPDVPTVRESGIADFEVLEWHGLFLPRGTPSAIVDRLAQSVREATNDPATAKRLRDMGIEPATRNRDSKSFTAYIDEQIEQWSTLIRERGIALE